MSKIGLKNDGGEVKFAYLSGGSFWIWPLPPTGFAGAASHSINLKSKEIRTENRLFSMVTTLNPMSPFEIFRIGADDETAYKPWKNSVAVDADGNTYVVFDPSSKINQLNLESQFRILFWSKKESEIPAEGRVVVWKRLGKDSYVPALTILPNHEFIFHDPENLLEDE